MPCMYVFKGEMYWENNLKFLAEREILKGGLGATAPENFFANHVLQTVGKHRHFLLAPPGKI